MISQIRLLLALTMLSLTFSCAHSVHDVQVSGFAPYAPLEQSGEVIKASSSQFVIFWFTTETNYVDEAYKKLQDKCPNGNITSIVTQYTTDLGFFSWTNRLQMQGVCRKSSASKTASL